MNDWRFARDCALLVFGCGLATLALAAVMGLIVWLVA